MIPRRSIRSGRFRFATGSDIQAGQLSAFLFPGNQSAPEIELGDDIEKQFLRNRLTAARQEQMPDLQMDGLTAFGWHQSIGSLLNAIVKKSKFRFVPRSRSASRDRDNQPFVDRFAKLLRDHL
jgi:hypothetical protein